MPKKVEYTVIEEAGEKVLRIDYQDLPYTPSLEDDATTMARTFNILLKVGPVQKIVFLQKEEYVYDMRQVKFLSELVDVYTNLVERENIFDFSKFKNSSCSRFWPAWQEFLRTTILHRLKEDPIGAYVELTRRTREEFAKQRNPPVPEYSECVIPFGEMLDNIISMLRQTELIRIADPQLPGHKVGTRTIYQRFFKPSIRPYFMYTKLITRFPTGAEELESYKIAEDTDVLVLRVPDDIRPYYHITPPEFKLTEEKYELLSAAREVMAEHRPERSEFLEPERTREIFYSVEKDLLRDLAKSKNIELDYKELEMLAKILLRYTIGFGLVEILLSDPKIQDIVVNAPIGISPISIIHADFAECRTNITPMPNEGESWATKLRLISGRPLDESNPVLDTDLTVPGGRARVAVMQQPLSPSGLAFAFRRHRDRTWTLPLFIENKMISPLAAGALSFLMDGARTLLVAGTRSAGKTSLLGALMVEIMRTNRVITIEDTLELPVKQLRDLGYDIQSMKVRSAITGSEAEVPAEQGVRTSLRLGDSALIVGEVRSKEALALWEAMRVGALAKTVAGTIHGESPYGVFDRVVNDLGVPRTSFKATDIIVVANPVTSPSGLARWRRVVQIAEVRKFWEEDPLREKGFADLFTYDTKKDELVATDVLTEGESEIIKAIGGRVKEWAGNWPAIWENIQLRAKTKQAIVDLANATGNRELMEAPFVVLANDEFHRISADVAEEVGYTDPKRVYSQWSEWLRNAAKKFSTEQ